MFLKIFCLTDGYTKPYTWFLNENGKGNKGKGEGSPNLWGVSKVEVAEYGDEIGSLILFIMKR